MSYTSIPTVYDTKYLNIHFNLSHFIIKQYLTFIYMNIQCLLPQVRCRDLTVTVTVTVSESDSTAHATTRPSSAALVHCTDDVIHSTTLSQAGNQFLYRFSIEIILYT